MITTGLKKFNNFSICYGSMRNGDIVYHANNDVQGLHTIFYGIRGDGYVLCRGMNEKVHPENMNRYIENISRFNYKTLEYHALSENNLDYLMLIKHKGVDIISVSDIWMDSGDQKIVQIDKDETILCFEGEAEVVHNTGSKIIKNLGSITSSKTQHVNIKSINNAKIVIVKCKRNKT